MFQAVFNLDEVNQGIAAQERYLKIEQGFNAVEATNVQLSWPFKRQSDKKTTLPTSTMKNGDKEQVKRGALYCMHAEDISIYDEYQCYTCCT